MAAQWLTLITPDGPFSLIGREGVVLASGWTDAIDRLLGLIHPSLRPQELPSRPGPDLAAARDAVNAYYDGDFVRPNLVPILQHTTPFRLRAWEALRTIRAGETITYSELAARAGNPRAVRAAGSACATNPASLFQPCHRVQRIGGSLGGFGFGLPLKASLLAREA